VDIEEVCGTLVDENIKICYASKLITEPKNLPYLENTFNFPLSSDKSPGWQETCTSINNVWLSGS
jgi:hypothetical protein